MSDCNYTDYDPYDRPTVGEMLGDDVRKVETELHDFVRDLASWYFDTDEWTDGHWEEWHDLVVDLI